MIDITGEEKRHPDSTSPFNRTEAAVVAEQAEEIHKAGVNLSDIGIITPYTAQIGAIASKLHNSELDKPGAVDIDTIDSFQGGEREAIIVSFVRSNEQRTAGFLEFPDEGPRRLNVALTRARKRLVMVSDFDTLSTVAVHREPTESCASLYAELVAHLTQD